MVAISPIPQAELKRVSTANVALVDIASALIGIAERESDPGHAAALLAQVTKLLDSSNAISAAIRSTAYVATRY